MSTLNTSKVTAIILCAGLGSRMRLGYNKVLLSIGDSPHHRLVSCTVRVFEESEYIDEIILVVKDDEREMIAKIINQCDLQKVARIIAGGKTRQESSCIGTHAAKSDIVIVHDGARPFVTRSMIRTLLKGCTAVGGSAIAVPITDTIYEVDRNLQVQQVLDRSTLWAAQTPQMAPRVMLCRCHDKALRDGVRVTDEMSLLMEYGYPVKIVKGDSANIKITTESDLMYLSQLRKEKY